MKYLLVALGIVALIVVIAVVIALPVMLIVNYLFAPAVLTAVFGVSQLTFWKAFWLAILTGLLFKSSNTSTK